MDPRLIALGLVEDPALAGQATAAGDAAAAANPGATAHGTAATPTARTAAEPVIRALSPATATRIRDAVRTLHDETLETVSRLVRIPSISPNYPGQDPAALVGGETRCAEFLAEIYRRAGAEVEVFGSVVGRDNAVGRIRGDGTGRSLLYNGHTDVVPPGPDEDWLNGDPWSGWIGNGRIVGRGASDMKAGLVAQAMAAVALRKAGVELAGDLILEAVVGEEMMEHELGTTACVERGYRADAAVVSEPSGPPSPLAICPVSPGLLWFTLSVQGKATHTSMRGATLEPGGESTGVSALDKLVLLHQAVARLERDWHFTKPHPLFQPGHFSIMPGVMVASPRSGLVPFAVPDEARMEVIVWYSPDESEVDVKAEIEEHISRAAAADVWLRHRPPRVTWRHHWPKSVLDADHPIVAAAAWAHERATGRAGLVAGFPAVEDTTWLNAAGIPAISYGPGDLRSAHAIDESVDTKEILEATLTYALLAAEWCGVAG